MAIHLKPLHINCQALRPVGPVGTFWDLLEPIGTRWDLLGPIGTRLTHKKITPKQRDMTNRSVCDMLLT